MAIITKIRNQSTLLIVLIGASMALFVIGDQFVADLFSDNGRPGEENVGTIAGEDISRIDFDRQVEAYIATRFTNGSPTQEQRTQIRNYIWNNMVQERILFSEAEEAGISLSADELLNITATGQISEVILTNLGIRDQQTRQIRPDFLLPDGNINNDRIKQVITNMNQDDAGKIQWASLEQDVIKDRIRTKYFNLIKQGMYVTQVEADQKYHEQNDLISFKYVGKKLNEVSDEEITVTDADLEAYYNAHKHEARFQQNTESRDMQYVVYDIIATAEDTAALEDRMTKVADQFKLAPKSELFASQKTTADQRFNVIQVVGEGDLAPAVDSLVAIADSGAVFGPYREGNAFKVVKVLGPKMDYDSVKVRHILIKNESMPAPDATAFLDSLQELVENGADFAALADEHTEDPGSKGKGGFYDFFGKGRMVKEFEQVAWDTPIGEMGIATTTYGQHLILVEGKKGETEKQKIAMIVKMIEPSEQTIDNVWDVANRFSMENQTSESFQTAGNAIGLRVADNVSLGQKSIPALGQAPEVIRWLFDSELGAISEPFEIDNKYIVAHVTGITPKGAKSLDAVRDLISMEVSKEKKREYLANKMAGSPTLEDAAAKIGSRVQLVDDLKFDGAAPQVGGEKDLIGALAGASLNQVTGPIESTSGVYMFIVTEVKKAEGEAPESLVSTSRLRLASGSQMNAYSALQKKADIDNFIARYYY